jgi:hypothetical protein
MRRKNLLIASSTDEHRWVSGGDTAARKCVPAGSSVIRRAKPAVAGTGTSNAVIPSKNWRVPAALRAATSASTTTVIPGDAPLGKTLGEVAVAIGPGATVTA